MVALVFTRAGFDDVRSRMDFGRDALWVNANLLTPTEVESLRAAGCNLTVFSNPLDYDDLDSYVATVVLHHPKQVLWVETVGETPDE